jgi:hypothetical protein
MPDAAAFATIDKPTLLVAASESPPEQREMTEAMADTLPNARAAQVAGGHLVDPAAPEVLALRRGSARASVAAPGESVGLPETPAPEDWPRRSRLRLALEQKCAPNAPSSGPSRR